MLLLRRSEKQQHVSGRLPPPPLATARCTAVLLFIPVPTVRVALLQPLGARMTPGLMLGVGPLM